MTCPYDKALLQEKVKVTFDPPKLPKMKNDRIVVWMMSKMTSHTGRAMMPNLMYCVVVVKWIILIGRTRPFSLSKSALLRVSDMAISDSSLWRVRTRRMPPMTSRRKWEGEPTVQSPSDNIRETSNLIGWLKYTITIKLISAQGAYYTAKKLLFTICNIYFGFRY